MLRMSAQTVMNQPNRDESRGAPAGVDDIVNEESPTRDVFATPLAHSVANISLGK